MRINGGERARLVVYLELVNGPELVEKSLVETPPSVSLDTAALADDSASWASTTERTRRARAAGALWEAAAPLPS